MAIEFLVEALNLERPKECVGGPHMRRSTQTASALDPAPALEVGHAPFDG